MHYLLFPYTLLLLAFAAQNVGRVREWERFWALVTSFTVLMLMFFGMLFRNPQGDSVRYYDSFIFIRDLSLPVALALPDGDYFFVILNWFVGQLGASHLLLFGATLLVYFLVFILALRSRFCWREVSILVVAYSAYPYFVAYGVNGLRQGIALVFLLMGFVQINRGSHLAWMWLLAAPLWHSGAWLGVIVAALHAGMCHFISNASIRWMLVIGIFFLSVVFSFLGLNEILMSGISEFANVAEQQQFYFEDDDRFSYRSGFRIDFLAFSLFPLMTAIFLRKVAPTFSYADSGWWLSLYLSLNVIYQMFSFAPYSDRFAGFSWFLVPLIVYWQVRGTRMLWLESCLVIVFCISNVVLLQIYTGNFIK